MAENDGLLGKVVASLFVLALSPFVEIVTAAAPIGTLGAAIALAVIWGIPFPIDEDGSTQS